MTRGKLNTNPCSAPGVRHVTEWTPVAPEQTEEEAVDEGTVHDVRFAWTDFEAEPDMTGDGSGDPDVFYLTIYEHGEEMATICHRASAACPVDGVVAQEKRAAADRIVEALRAFHGER